MYTTITRSLRTLFAAAAVVAATFALSAVSVAFLPADPHVEAARAQAMLDRADQIRGAQALRGGHFRTASAMSNIR